MVSSSISEIIFYSFFIFAVRNFHAKNEEIKAPRAWWRVTAQPRAGFVIAALAAICIPFYVHKIFLSDSVGAAWFQGGLYFTVSTSAIFVVFLHSSIRLAKMKTVKIVDSAAGILPAHKFQTPFH
ncbi:MAG: hypothetical protein H7248_06940 [Microbacteriaceae bacterium]|nr:hypothetical protein [Microbacteriaceae bacterium]